jgi:hypothetical protein
LRKIRGPKKTKAKLINNNKLKAKRADFQRGFRSLFMAVSQDFFQDFSFGQIIGQEINRTRLRKTRMKALHPGYVF